MRRATPSRLAYLCYLYCRCTYECWLTIDAGRRIECRTDMSISKLWVNPLQARDRRTRHHRIDGIERRRRVGLVSNKLWTCYVDNISKRVSILQYMQMCACMCENVCVSAKNWLCEIRSETQWSQHTQLTSRLTKRKEHQQNKQQIIIKKSD